MRDKRDVMRLHIKNGIRDLDGIKNSYNKLSEGGETGISSKTHDPADYKYLNDDFNAKKSEYIDYLKSPAHYNNNRVEKFGNLWTATLKEDIYPESWNPEIQSQRDKVSREIYNVNDTTFSKNLPESGVSGFSNQKDKVIGYKNPIESTQYHEFKHASERDITLDSGYKKPIEEHYIPGIFDSYSGFRQISDFNKNELDNRHIAENERLRSKNAQDFIGSYGSWKAMKDKDNENGNYSISPHGTSIDDYKSSLNEDIETLRYGNSPSYISKSDLGKYKQAQLSSMINWQNQRKSGISENYYNSAEEIRANLDSDRVDLWKKDKYSPYFKSKSIEGKDDTPILMDALHLSADEYNSWLNGNYTYNKRIK